MLLLYTHQITHRVKYTFNLIFKSVLDVNFEITTDKEYFKQFQSAKFSYTDKQIADELFFQSGELLFETGVKIITEVPSDSFALSFF